MHGVKLSSLILVLTWVSLATLQWFSPAKDVWEVVRWGGVGGLLLMTIVGFLTTRDMIPLGQQAEDVFEVLGVSKFKRFRIKPFSIMNLEYLEAEDSSKKGHIYKFAEALAAHKKKFRLK
jgi:hypothetical protein